MATTVAEIKSLLSSADKEEFEALERSLAADTRKGVRQAIEVCRRRFKAEEEELARVASLFKFDANYVKDFSEGLVLGLDEVGRGAVAGPLAVGAVVFSSPVKIPLLNDSKQLSFQQREEVSSVIKEKALAWDVSYIKPDEIDRIGMAAALRKAFIQAIQDIESQGISIACILLDGNPLGIDSREINIVKGDTKSASIAAASIVAKVERDHFMMSLNSTYPQYGFSSHKGYGSAEHIEAIKTYGLCPVHRETFCRSFTQPSLF